MPKYMKIAVENLSISASYTNVTKQNFQKSWLRHIRTFVIWIVYFWNVELWWKNPNYIEIYKVIVLRAQTSFLQAVKSFEKFKLQSFYIFFHFSLFRSRIIDDLHCSVIQYTICWCVVRIVGYPLCPTAKKTKITKYINALEFEFLKTFDCL